MSKTFKFLSFSFLGLVLLLGAASAVAAAQDGGRMGPPGQGNNQQGQPGNVPVGQGQNGQPGQMNGQGQPPMGENVEHGTMGTITAIDDEIITMQGRAVSTTVTYTVDASDATILKMVMPEPVAASSSERTAPTSTEISLSDLVVGNTIMVEGTVNDDNEIVATKIMLGNRPGNFGQESQPNNGTENASGTRFRGDNHSSSTPSTTSAINSNGQQAGFWNKVFQPFKSFFKRFF